MKEMALQTKGDGNDAMRWTAVNEEQQVEGEEGSLEMEGDTRVRRTRI
jgi:hypothetical protein